MTHRHMKNVKKTRRVTLRALLSEDFSKNPSRVRLAPPTTPEQAAAFEELLRWALRAMGEGPSTADAYMKSGRGGDWSDALDALAIFYTMKRIPFTRVATEAGAPAEKKLREAAASPSSAHAEGLALFTQHQPGWSRQIWILWDPAEATKIVRGIVKGWGRERREIFARSPSAGQSELFEDWNRALKDNPGRVVRGFLAVHPNDDSRAWGASEVVLAAAEHGYGPLMYDIALSEYPRLMPDRDSVSKSAAAVWARYFSGRPDVTKFPLDNVDRPRTPDPRDDAQLHKPEGSEDDPNPLNYAYESQKILSTDALEARSAETFEALRGFGFDERFLIRASSLFFSKMQGV